MSKHFDTQKNSTVDTRTHTYPPLSQNAINFRQVNEHFDVYLYWHRRTWLRLFVCVCLLSYFGFSNSGRLPGNHQSQ